MADIWLSDDNPAVRWKWGNKCNTHKRHTMTTYIHTYIHTCAHTSGENGGQYTKKWQYTHTPYTVMIYRATLGRTYSSVVGAEPGSSFKTEAVEQSSTSPVSGCTHTRIGEACKLFLITHTWRSFSLPCSNPATSLLLPLPAPSLSFPPPTTATSFSLPRHLLRLACRV